MKHKTYFVSDLHFGHANVINFDKRPWPELESMTRDLIANWNATVTNADTVYILGDLFWTHESAHEVLPQLKGRKILIRGNHDEGVTEQAETTQDEVALIQRWVAYQVERMIASSHRVRILPLCTDSEGRLSRSGHEVGQLHILLDGMLSMQPLRRISLHIQGPRGLVTSGLGSPNNSDRLFQNIEWWLFQNIEWSRRVTLARIEYSLS